VTAVDVAGLLADLEALHAAATPGPWSVEQHDRLRPGCMCLSCWEPVDAWDIREVDGPDCAQHGCWHNISLEQPDAELIAAMRTALPTLLRLARAGEALRTGVLDMADRADRHGYDLTSDDLRGVVAAAEEG